MSSNRSPVVLIALLALAGCGQDPAPAPQDTVADSPAPPAATATAAAPEPAAGQVPPPLAEADKGETGARNVLQAWARALERGDYATAFAQWGAEAEARSGMTAAEHDFWWSRFKTVAVATTGGTIQGAAGSSYYEAPTTVVGKLQDGTPYRLDGTVVLRRVNDVPGATPDQLRWHIERVDLEPAA